MIGDLSTGIGEVVKDGSGKLPYQALLDVYRQLLETEKNPKRKRELEFAIVVLIGLLELQKSFRGLRELLEQEE